MLAERRQRSDADGLLRVSMLTADLSLIGGLSFLLLALGLLGPISELLLGRTDYWLIGLAALSIPFVAMQAPMQHVLQGLEDASGQAMVNVAYGAVFAIAAVTGALAAGVKGAVVGLLVGNVALLALYLARRRQLVAPYERLGQASHKAALRKRLRTREKNELLRVGVASTVVLAMAAAADLSVRSVIQHRFGDGEAGRWYALLLLSSQFIGVITGSLSYFTAPLLSRIKETRDFAQTRRVLDDSLRLTFGVMFPLLILIAVARSPLVDLFFSPKFHSLVEGLPIMLAADGFRLVAWTLGVALVPLGLTRHWLLIATVGLAAYVGGAYLTVGDLGASGGAIGWAALWALSGLATAGLLMVRRVWRPSLRTAMGFIAGMCALGLAAILPTEWAIPPTLFLGSLTVWASSTPSERAAVGRRLGF